MEGGISRGRLVIQEPSMEDFNKRRKCDEDDNRFEKMKRVVQHVGELPFILDVVLISAKTINGFSPVRGRRYYIVAWVERTHWLKTRPCVVPFVRHAVFQMVVEPEMKYLYLELVHDNGAYDDPESSQRMTLAGVARLKLQNYRNQFLGRRRERVRERLVQLSAGEDGDFRFEERWEVLMEISTREAVLRPTLVPSEQPETLIMQMLRDDLMNEYKVGVSSRPADHVANAIVLGLFIKLNAADGCVV